MSEDNNSFSPRLYVAFLLLQEMAQAKNDYYFQDSRNRFDRFLKLQFTRFSADEVCHIDKMLDILDNEEDLV